MIDVIGGNMECEKKLKLMKAVASRLIVDAKGIKMAKVAEKSIAKNRNLLSPTRLEAYPAKNELKIPIKGPIENIKLAIASEMFLSTTIYEVMKVNMTIVPIWQAIIEHKKRRKFADRTCLGSLISQLLFDVSDTIFILKSRTAQKEIGIIQIRYANRQLSYINIIDNDMRPRKAPKLPNALCVPIALERSLS
ncbi:MAG: hypothetical protein QXJ17_07585 [Nitrososphaeria archaeon]